jgi:hypothetical protein
MSIREKRPGPGIYALLFLLLLAFNACKKEKDLFDYLQLIGKWEMESETCKEYFDGELAYDQTSTYEPGSTFLEFRSDGTGATFDRDSLVLSFEWSRSDNTININSDNPGMISAFTILSLDQYMLEYRVRVTEELDDPEAEYLSFCDYTLQRVEDGS